MSKARRTRQNRRDRRIAKQTNFARPGKSNPKKVGHGGSGQISNKTGTKTSRSHKDNNLVTRYDEGVFTFEQILSGKSDTKGEE